MRLKLVNRARTVSFHRPTLPMKNCMPSGQTVKILNELTIIPIQVNDAKDITRENEKFNRVAIDVFLAAQVARQKGLRPSHARHREPPRPPSAAPQAMPGGLRRGGGVRKSAVNKKTHTGSRAGI